MKNLIKHSRNIVQDALQGFVKLHADLLFLEKENLIINKQLTNAERVTLVAFGACGNELGFSRYVGEGLVDVAVVGDLLSAPGPQSCLDALKMADKGYGVVLLNLNQLGDNLSAEIAAKEAEKLGIKVSRIVVCDEVVLGEGLDVRRGLGGCLPVCKIIGAAALNGKSLEEITRLAQSFIDNMATVTIAFNDKEMKLNSGIRGENDGEIIASTTSDALAIEVTSMLIQDLQLQAGEVVYTMINTSGNINHIEAAIFGRDVLNALEQHDFVLASIVSGALFEMPETSVQVTLARMEQEVKSYLAAPCNSVAYKIK